MASTLAPKVKDVGSIPDFGAIFPIFITTHDTGYRDYDPVQAMCRMVVELSLCNCIYKAVACMYVIVSTKKHNIPCKPFPRCV